MSPCPSSDRLLSRKELADAAGCSPWYVTRAKHAGFVMPGRRATLAEFRQWLRDHADFVAKHWPASPRLPLPPAASM